MSDDGEIVQSMQILRSIRSLRAMVIHPPDTHGQELVAQLSRIGCRTETLWPPPSSVADYVDLLFIEVRETIPDCVNRMLQEMGENRPTIIGLAGYENPSVLKSVLDLRVEAVITKPLRPYGVLTSLVMGRRIWDERRRLHAKIDKLSAKVRSTQKLTRAKVILMNLHQITEDEAYRRIRSQAMAKRATTIDIAQAIINAADILGNMSSAGSSEGEESL